MADSLREELLAIPGIDGADFDGSVIAPEGVRVRLASGADPYRVGEEVRRVLADHGLRSHMTSPAVAPDVPPAPPPQLEPAEPPPPPPEPEAPVVAMPNVPPALGPVEAVRVPPVEESAPQTDAVPATDPVAAADPVVETAESATTPEVEIIEPGTGVESGAAPAGAVTVRSVAVAEARDGLTVVATRSDGLTVERPARNPGKGLDAAVVGAVAELVGDDGARSRLIGVYDAEADGVGVVTVVVEVDDGSLRAGSAVVEGGRAFGVARATWRALSSPV